MYKAPMTKEISLQSDMQFVVNPGAVTGLKDAFVVGMRFKMAL